MTSHSVVFEGLALAGADRPVWWTLSTTPSETLNGLFSTLPIVALFILVAHLDAIGRRYLSVVIGAVGVVSVFLGLIQVAQGPTSVLRFFEITNSSEAVGFFANRNHYAALLYVTILLSAAWLIQAMTRMQDGGLLKVDAGSFVLVATVFLVLFLSLSGQLMARSRAGIGLTMAALIGAYCVVSMTGPRKSNITGRLVIAAIVLSLWVATQFALYRILDRFDADPFADARIVIGQNTSKAVMAFLPFGTGIGSFVPTYGAIEQPGDTFAAFANRAHNDLLEMWLESGVLGMIFVSGLVLWVGYRTIQVWRPQVSELEPIDIALMRSSTLIVSLLLLHSLVDYPLRTAALSAIFAIACAFLIPPVPIQARPNSSDRLRATGAAGPSRIWQDAHLDRAEFTPASRELFPVRPSKNQRPFAGDPLAAAPKLSNGKETTSGRWGRDIEWPVEWTDPGRSDQSKPDDR